jgi:adenylate cyclase
MGPALQRRRALTTERVERRLTAILAADVAGYSRLTGADEEGTHVRLKQHLRVLVDPKIEQYRGRIVKNTGDGMLAEFGSVVDAVRCAIDVQRGMAERNAETPPEKQIEFRIGINVGDVISDSGDIFGDGVNVAVRLEEIAEPGGICVSRRVQEYVEGQIDITFDDVGDQKLKNIAFPTRVYRVRLANGSIKPKPALVLPDKPSIAVLPFQNMSGDLEQDYFADGMVEEIITALSRMRWLFVIARNSSFTYKGRAVDVKQVGRELGVRYVVEGSVRKAGNRVRITGQLIDATSAAHLWADRYDGALEDIFDLQDQVTASVVNAIAPKLEKAEIERAKRKRTESLDAYDYYLRGMSSLRQEGKKAISEALRLFKRAIELDPDFATAYGMAASCYVRRKVYGWMSDSAKETFEARHLARLAARLGKDDPVALCWAGHTLAHVVEDLDGGAALIDHALVLDPNLATAWHFSGWVRLYLGNLEVAIDHLTHAMRLSPLDPYLFAMQTGTATAHFVAGRYDEALSWAEKAIRLQSNFLGTIRIFAASSALAGRIEDAQKAMARVRQIAPALRISNLQNAVPFRRPEHLARYAEGLRKAGLPE